MAQQQSFADYAAGVTTTADIDGSVLVFPTTAITNWPNTFGGTIPFVATINRGKNDAEKVLVASTSANQINVAPGGRGHGGGTPQPHDSGATIEHTLDGGFLSDLSAQRFAVSTKGDLPYVGVTAGVQMARLGIGADGQVLGVSGGVPAWQPSMEILLATTGEMLYASAPNVPAALSPGANGTVLVIAGGLPTWGTDTVGAAALTAEVTRAEAAETANTTLITAETTRATAAETANTTLITAETTRAEAAEAALTLADSGWLSNGVVNYRKIGSQVFTYMGTHTQANGGTFGTLPAGYRPVADQVVTCLFGTSVAGIVVLTSATGVVTPTYTGSTASCAGFTATFLIN